MQQLQTLAKTTNKMMILIIHQPSSRLYNMFDSLLLLSKGSVAYFGDAHEAPLEFFQTFGFVCGRFCNPADFYMEILTKKDVDLDKIVATNIQSNKRMEVKDNTRVLSNTSSVTNSFSSLEIIDVQNLSSTTPIVNAKPMSEKWPTSFATQLKMLTRRNYMQTKGSMMPLFDVIMYAVVCACAALVFFQIKEKMDSIRDRLGLLYFYLTFWDFVPMSQALFAMQSERSIISKERNAGAYRLSAYYIAKPVSELPLRIIMPALFYTIVYWVAGLGGVAEFFMTLPLALLNALNSQGLGMFLGTVFMNGRAAFLCGETIILMGVVFSGYLTYSVPPWFTWSKYLSILYYPLGALGIILFRDMDNIPCNATSVSTFQQCLSNATDFVTASDILENATIDIPLYCYVSTLVLIFAVLRLATYVALRYQHQPTA